MISKEHVLAHDSFKKDVMKATEHSVNQFTTIKYRWSSVSMFLVVAALSSLLAILDVQSSTVKIFLAVLAGALLGISIFILRRSPSIENVNKIHSSTE